MVWLWIIAHVLCILYLVYLAWRSGFKMGARGVYRIFIEANSRGYYATNIGHCDKCKESAKEIVSFRLASTDTVLCMSCIEPGELVGKS